MPEKYRGPLLSQHGFDAGGGERNHQKVYPWHDRLVESPQGTGKGAWRDVSEKSVGRLVSLAFAEYRGKERNSNTDPSAAIAAFDLENAIEAHPRILDKVLDNPGTYSYDGKVFIDDATTQRYKEALDLIFADSAMYSYLLTIRKIRKERDIERLSNAQRKYDTDIATEALERIGKPKDETLLRNYNSLTMMFFEEVEDFAYKPSIINKYESIDAVESALRTLLVDAVSTFSWDTYVIDQNQTIQRFIGYMKGSVKQLGADNHADFSSDLAFSRLVNKDTGLGIADRLADSTNIEQSTISKMGLENLLERIGTATASLPPIATEIFVEYALGGGGKQEDLISALAQQFALTPEDITDYIGMVRGLVLAAQSGEPLPQPSVQRQKKVEGLPRLASFNATLSFLADESERQRMLSDFSDTTIKERRIYEIALAASNGTWEKSKAAVRDRFPDASSPMILISIYESLRKEGHPYRYYEGNKTVWTALQEMRDSLESRLEASGEKIRDRSGNLRLAIEAARAVPQGGDIKAAIIAAFQAKYPGRNPDAIDTALKDAMRMFFPTTLRGEWEVTAHKVLQLAPQVVLQRLEETGVGETAAGKLVKYLVDQHLATGDRHTTYTRLRHKVSSPLHNLSQSTFDTSISTVMREIFKTDEQWEALGLGTRNMYRRFRVYGEEMLHRLDEVRPEVAWTLSPREKQVLSIALRAGVSTRKDAITAVQAEIPELRETGIDMLIRRAVKNLVSEEEWQEMVKDNVFLGGWLQQRKFALGSDIHSRERTIAQYGDILKAALEAKGSNPESIIDQVFAKFPNVKRSKIRSIIIQGINSIATPEQKQRIHELRSSPVWDKLFNEGEEVMDLLSSERGLVLRPAHRAILKKAVEVAKRGAKGKTEIVKGVFNALGNPLDPEVAHLRFETKSIDRAIRYACNILYGNADYNGVKHLQSLIRHKEKQQMRRITGYPDVPQDFWDSLPTFPYKRDVWRVIIEAYFFSDIHMTHNQISEYVYRQAGITISESRVSRTLDAIRQRILNRRVAVSLERSL